MGSLCSSTRDAPEQLADSKSLIGDREPEPSPGELGGMSTQCPGWPPTGVGNCIKSLPARLGLTPCHVEDEADKKVRGVRLCPPPQAPWATCPSPPQARGPTRWPTPTWVAWWAMPVSSLLIVCVSRALKCWAWLCARGVIHGQGVYSTGFSEIGFWIGFGEVWIRKHGQTQSKACLGGTRDRF